VSVSDQDQALPIVPGSPLARALDDFAVPALSAGFADRLMAAAEARPAPLALPPLRRSTGGRGWRLGRRVAIGVVSFGALASAAAATGLLEQLNISVPSADKVWASLTGKQPVVAAAAVPVAAAPAASDPAALAPVAIVGPIDTPEELGEAFRRIDAVRQGRSEVRRQVIDHRITRELERRRAAGLPVPSPEGEARLRERIEAVQTEREGRADERIRARREALERRVESGEALTRDDLLPARPQGAPRLRDLTPQERRAVLRDLSPEDRRAVAEEYRRRRDQREGRQQLRRAQGNEGTAAPAPEAVTATPPADAAATPQPKE